MKINKSILSGIFLLLLANLAQAKTCNVTEKIIHGAWLEANADAPFEQMEFSVEGKQKVFNSWLHDRPEISNGSWSLQGCKLHIAHPTDDNLNYNFSVRLNHGKLELKEKGAPTGKFTRYKE